MKHYLFACLFFLIPFVSEGQTRNLPVRYQATIGTGIPMSTPSAVPFVVEGKAFYHFSSRFSAGIGTGFSLYDKDVLIPLTGNLQFDLFRPARFTPYLDCTVGYSFAPSGKVEGGLYLSPALGVRMQMCSDKKLLFALGYELQKLRRLREHSAAYLVSSYEEPLSYSYLSVKLGFLF